MHLRGSRAAATAIVLAGLAAVTAIAASRQAGRPAGAVPPDVRAAAETGLRTILGLDAGRGVDRLGFRDRADADAAAIGFGLRIHTVRPDLLLAGDSTDLAQLTTPTSQWLFLVLSGGRPRSLLIVDLVGGAWTAVSVGGADLAAELAAVLERWPGASYQHRFVRSHEAAAEFLEVSRGGRPIGSVPLASARVSLGAAGRFDPGDLWPAARVVERMRPAVEAALSQKR